MTAIYLLKAREEGETAPCKLQEKNRYAQV